MTKKINIAVLSKAGKCGKSTIAKQLIAPMIGADWIQIETINDVVPGSKSTISGHEMGFIDEAMSMQERNMVFDIGISNYEHALKKIGSIEGFAEDVDFWVIPAQPILGHINETLATVTDLINELDVNPKKIIVIPNAVEDEKKIHKDFVNVINAAKIYGFCFVDTCVLENDIFQLLSDNPRSIISIAEEVIDYNSMIAAELNSDKKKELAADKTIQRQAKAIARNLRGVWNSSPLSSLTA